MTTLTQSKKKPVIFILLLASLVSLLLIDSEVYNFMSNQWDKTVVYFARPDFDLKTTTPRPETSTSSTSSTTQSKPDVPQCSYKYLSPENTKEGRRLLDSITWPETLPLSKPFNLSLSTCAAKSWFSIVPRSGGWRVGDELTVSIQLRDYNGKPKKSGGDYLTCRLHNRKLGAGVVGQVQDHLNGTFTAVFPLLWNGTADVEVTLVQTSESITVLKHLTEEHPGRVWYSSDFTLGNVTEKSLCNVCLHPDKAPVCNFTDLHTGEQWFCYKPSTLDCNTRVSHVVDWPDSVRINKEEELLFQRGINMKARIKAVGSATATILPKAGETKKIKPEPSGYYYGNQWRPLGGPTVHQFNSASNITACLKGKQLYMFGDSTARQFYEFITQKQPDLLSFKKYGTPQCGPFLAIDHGNDIMMTFRCHGPPLRNYKINLSQVQYVANELDRLNGGPNTVVVIGVWAHFASTPLEVYYQRLMSIRRAVGRLLNRAPGTKVFVRTANMKDMTLDGSIFTSDWYSLQQDKVLRAVFKDSGVLLLEAWEMVQAHYLPHNLHPPPQIIKLMVDMILTHTCPEKRD